MPPPAPVRIEIPRWTQLVLLPILLLLLWTVAGAVRHVLFLFLVSLLIALLLNPLVRGSRSGEDSARSGGSARLSRLRSSRRHWRSSLSPRWSCSRHAPRPTASTTTLRSIPDTRRRRAPSRISRGSRPGSTTIIWAASTSSATAGGSSTQVGTKDVQKYTSKALSWAEGAGLTVVTLLFDAVLLVVVSIYILLDMQRLTEAVDRRFPPHGRGGLIVRMEQAVASYVKGQFLLSLIIGVSVGLGLYLLGVVGLFPNGEKYAAAFGAWAAVTELIPYIGPWLGAIPPVLYALVQHPLSALWVALLFLGIQQLEGHVVVPKVMGRSLRLHPLLVIFGLLAGGEIYGFAGILVALPLLAAGRAAWEFFAERVEFQTWSDDAPLGEIRVEPKKPPISEPPPAPTA